MCVKRTTAALSGGGVWDWFEFEGLKSQSVSPTCDVHQPAFTHLYFPDAHVSLYFILPAQCVYEKQKRCTLAPSVFLAEFGRFPTKSCPSHSQAAGCRTDKVVQLSTLTLAASWDVKVATFS